MNEAAIARGRALAADGKIDDAATAFESALALDPDREDARWALYELEQLRGNTRSARAHQAHVLARKRLFSRVAPREERRVLALLAPGDFKANAPLEFVFDAERTTLHRYFVTLEDDAKRLPEADVVFVAIGESPEAMPTLRRAASLTRALGLPVLNAPRYVPRTNRAKLSQLVKGIACCSMPRVARHEREELAGGDAPLEYPFVVRPIGSQAGERFARVASRAELDAYLSDVPDDAFFVSPFANYARADGFYRKYRVVVVDGEPYPYHLAISPHWMVHYYNTPMRDTPWMREEERRFLAGEDAFAMPPIREALRELARRLHLDYFGVDCTLDAHGNLLIFEADTAMIVHLLDPRDVFPYKYDYVPRIFNALERLVDARKRA